MVQHAYDPRRPGAALAGREAVTASTLVRQFGIWQERAAKEPVYILHRGRPRLVLTSIDIMGALLGDHGGGGEAERLASVLDAVREMVVLVDPQLAVIAASRSARRYFGLSGGDLRLVDLAAPAAVDLLVETARRVLASGIAETIELAAARFGDRRLTFEIMPAAGELLMMARDATLADELHELRARMRAQLSAIEAMPDIAVASVNTRGYVVGPADSLAALAGVAPEALSRVRFVTLLDLGSRVATAEAIEAVAAGDGARTLEAMLLVNRAAPRPVRIGLGLSHGLPGSDTVQAIMVATARPPG